MKRFFKNLKAMALVAVVGVAAVSCAEAYDDTELKQQVADLAERVTKLEERLDSEVTALRALIDEKVALAEVQEDGAWKFTLANGKALTLYPEYVENGLTVVTEDGVQYWAKVEGNVTTILTDAAGNKVAFHNAPELRVNAENIIEVSVDGGKSWVATQAPSLFAAIDVKDNHACLTLQNGQELKFALYEQVNFSVNGNVLFVGSEESEKVTMTLDGIVELFPLVVPEGWSVDIDGLVMTVTAPYAEPEAGGGGGMPGWPGMPGMGGAEEEVTPSIKVLAISKEGKSVVATLYVVASGNGGQSIKVMGDQLVITNNKQVEDMDYVTWEPIMVPAPIAYTAFPTGEYTFESFAAAKQNYEYGYEILYFEENGTKTINVADALKEICGVEKIERGDSYTFIAFDANLYAPTVTDIMSAVYTSTYVDVVQTAVTFKDIQLDITVEGYDGYLVYIQDAAYEENVEEIFQYWQMGYQQFGVEFTANYSGSLFDIDNSGMIMPYANRVYIAYVLPTSALKSASDYKWDDVKTYTFKTKNYTAGGMLLPKLESCESDYQYINATIAPATGAYRTHAFYYTADVLSKFPGEEDLVADIIKNGMVSQGENPVELRSDALTPGTTVTIASICVDMNGKYGPILKEECSTKAMDYSAATIEITDWELNVTREMKYTDSSYSFDLKTTGEIANTYVRLIQTNQYMSVEKQLTEVALAVINDGLGGYYVPIENIVKNDAGKYAPAGRVSAVPYSYGYAPTVSVGLNYGYTYLFVVVGEDADGKPTKVAYKEFETFVPMTIVYADDAKWTASKPTVTIGEPEVLETMYESLKKNWEDIYDMYVNQWGMTEEEAKQQMEMMVSYGELQDPEKLSAEEKAAPASLNIPFTVTPGAGAVKCLVEYNSDGNFDEVATRTWIDNMVADAEAAPADGKVSQHLVYEISAETTLTAQSVSGHVTNYVYITWQDADGNWYEATENVLYKALNEE